MQTIDIPLPAFTDSDQKDLTVEELIITHSWKI